ncbi:MAG TPA: hypothetical protein VFR70_07025 [Flavobacterium sp.]|nr:hypothetical protein [Flavobacterium sp.]
MENNIFKNAQQFFACCMLITAINAGAQVGIGTTAPNAALDITSANEGVLIPRVELTATNVVSPVITPAASELVYNTATVNDVTPGFYYLNPAANGWIRLATGADAVSGWSLNGNAGTNPGSDFLGTTDSKDLIVKTNNSEKMRVTSAGNIGIGTTVSPAYKLEVNAVSDPIKLNGILNQAADNKLLTIDAAGVVKKRSLFNLANVWVGDPATDNANGTAWRLQGIQTTPAAADIVTLNSPGTTNEADVAFLLATTTIPKASCNFTVPYATNVQIDAHFNLEDLSGGPSQQPYVYFELYLTTGGFTIPTGIFALTSPDYAVTGASAAAFGHFTFSMSGTVSLPAAGNYTLTLRGCMRYNTPGTPPANYSRAVAVLSSNVVVIY